MQKLKKLRWEIALALLIFIGVFFRFYNLDKKVFWGDETRSALRVSGHSLPEMYAELTKQGLWTPAELQKFQRINAGRGVSETIRSLTTDDPKHPPLFYVLLRVWAGVFGDSPGALRALAALLSLLVFPAVWFLCRELFFDAPNHERIAWVAIALLAVSPFHVLYAQEAREYSLWTACLALCCALLLRALRLENWKSWMAYAAALALSFYVHTLTISVFLAHVLFVLICHRGQWRKFFGASIVAALLFAPWAIFIWLRRIELFVNTMWVAMPSSRFHLIKSWFFNWSSVFVDIADPRSLVEGKIGSLLVAVFVQLLRVLVFTGSGLALWSLSRRNFSQQKTPRNATFVFIVLLIAVPFLLFAIPDLLSGGVRSSIGRFMTPSLMGIQLAVAFLCAQKIVERSTRRRWSLVLGVLLSAGIFSCLQSSQTPTWWTKGISFHTPRVARTVNRAPKPVVVFSTQSTTLLVLGSLLKSDAKIFAATKGKLDFFDPQQFANDKNIETIFLYEPTESLIRKLREQNWNLQKVDDDDSLWRIERL